MSHSRSYLLRAAELAAAVNWAKVDELAAVLRSVRDCDNRVFCLGNGGGAAVASHAVNDLRKLCHIEAYAPTDNAAELTARANDDGWDRCFVDWLEASRVRLGDAILAFSVGGGGDLVSRNLALAIDRAAYGGLHVLGVVGERGGRVAEAARVGGVCVALPTGETPHVEGLQSVVLHCVVSHPLLRDPPIVSASGEAKSDE